MHDAENATPCKISEIHSSEKCKLFHIRLYRPRLKLRIGLYRIQRNFISRLSTIPEVRPRPFLAVDHTGLAEIVLIDTEVIQRALIEIHVTGLGGLFERAGMEVQVLAYIRFSPGQILADVLGDVIGRC